MEKCYFIADSGFDSLEDAVEYFAENYDFESGETCEVKVYKKQNYTHNSFLRVDIMLEHMANVAYDENEYADDYLNDIIYDKDKMKKLEDLILSFLNENSSSPSFWNGVGEPLEVISLSKEYLISEKYL